MMINALAVLALALFITDASACVFVYGDRDEAAKAAGGHFTYSYNGDDWTNDFPTCRGHKQSPILLPSSGAAALGLQAPAAKSTFSYGEVTRPIIVNNGHTLQVALPADFQSDVQIPVIGDTADATATSIVTNESNSKITYVKATPAQFHFHTHSEHVVSGSVYPLEMHIVHFVKSDQLPACGNASCPVVLGIMIALTDDESLVSPTLRRIITAMPLIEGTNNTIEGTISVDSLLPQTRTYFTYEGSLTTPPCTEGILWHVLATPKYISQSLLTHYLQATGSYNCPETTAAAANGSGAFQVPPADADGCVKLADGHNYRAAQPLGTGRSIMLAA